MSDIFVKAQNFINEVEDFSQIKLNKKAALIRLYEEALKRDKEKLFGELTFSAKYVQGLLRVLKSSAGKTDIQNLDTIKKDFTSNMEKVVEQIKEILAESDVEVQQYFNQNFLELSSQGLLELSELLHDLEWVKMYTNRNKK